MCAAEEKDGWGSLIDGGAQRAPLGHQTRATEPYYFNAQWGHLVRPCPRNKPYHFHKPVATKQGLVLYQITEGTTVQSNGTTMVDNQNSGQM